MVLELTRCCILMQIQQELVSSIRDAEEGLLYLKRARLLSEIDSSVQSVSSHVDAKVEPIYLAEVEGSKLSHEDIEAEPLDATDEVETSEKPGFFVGSKCRFRHTDGHWYHGEVLELDGSSARVSFLHPTSENMMVIIMQLIFSLSSLVSFSQIIVSQLIKFHCYFLLS